MKLPNPFTGAIADHAVQPLSRLTSSARRGSLQGRSAASSAMRVCTPFCFLLAAFLCGCSFTYIGHNGVVSPDGRFRVSTECDGAYGHAYIDKSKKKFWVWIGSGSGTNYTPLFQHRYTITGSDVEWQAHWSSDETVFIETYDWGDGISNYKNMEHMAASNHIALFSFALDKSTGKFVEQR